MQLLWFDVHQRGVRVTRWPLVETQNGWCQHACHLIMLGFQSIELLVLELQAFISGPKRVEATFIAVYDSVSVLSKSPEAIAMREVLSRQNVVVLKSQGPAALVMNLVRSPCGCAHAQECIMHICNDWELRWHDVRSTLFAYSTSYQRGISVHEATIVYI
jgi:hypothetical protein